MEHKAPSYIISSSSFLPLALHKSVFHFHISTSIMESIGVLFLPRLPFRAPSAASSSSSSSSPSSSSTPTPTPTQPSPPQQPQQQGQSTVYHITVGVADAATAETRDEAWSCLVTLAAFWFFASMILIMGVYASHDLVLGPNCSQLLQANSLFVQDITVKTDEYSKQGPTIYEFSFLPLLDAQTTWSEFRNASVPSNFHKAWAYYLNQGAQVNISYSLKSPSEYPLILVITEGRDSLVQWIEKPSYSYAALSWTLMHGTGMIEQIIERPSDYYIAVGNLNQLGVEVQLNFSFLNVLYNTTGSCSKCSLDHKSCVLDLSLYKANFAVLTTPQIAMEGGAEWHIKVSYGPRWATYFIASGMLTLLVLLTFKMFTYQQQNSGDSGTRQHQEATNERSPLISNKDDENMSLGSSYESVSNGEEDLDEAEAPKLLGHGEADDSQQLCTICCDAKRDCFFLPCGHCALCYTCGTRLLDDAGVCPICRRKMKKVRKIFTV